MLPPAASTRRRTARSPPKCGRGVGSSAAQVVVEHGQAGPGSPSRPAPAGHADQQIHVLAARAAFAADLEAQPGLMRGDLDRLGVVAEELQADRVRRSRGAPPRRPDADAGQLQFPSSASPVQRAFSLVGLVSAEQFEVARTASSTASLLGRAVARFRRAAGLPCASAWLYSMPSSTTSRAAAAAISRRSVSFTARFTGSGRVGSIRAATVAERSIPQWRSEGALEALGVPGITARRAVAAMPTGRHRRGSSAPPPNSPSPHSTLLR